MSTFYAVVEGDPLDGEQGGYVTASSKAATVKGEDGQYRYLVFLGDEAYCAACESVGVIVRSASCADSRRMIDLTNAGRRQAVGGDVVVCRCAQPPSIIAMNGRSWMIHNGDDSAAANSASAATATTAFCAPGAAYDEQVRAVAAGVMLDGYPYLIETTGGETHTGRLGMSGNLPRIDTDANREDYTVYWGDDALARQADQSI